MSEGRDQSFLTVATSTIGSVGLLCVYFIAAYNSGYFAALGVEYLHFFSLTDLLLSSLFLMPVTVLTVTLSCGSFAIYYMLSRRPSFQSSWGFFWALTFFSVSSGAVTSFTEDRIMTVIAYVGGLIYFLSCAMAYKWAVVDKLSSSIFPLGSFLGLSTVIILFGVYMANMDMRYRTASLITMDDQSGIEARVIRASTQGLLVSYCSDGFLGFIAWTKVANVRRSSGCASQFDSTIPVTLRYLYF